MLLFLRICTGGHFGYAGNKTGQEALEALRSLILATPTTVQIDYYGRNCSQEMSIWEEAIKISIPVNSRTVSRPGATLHECAQGRGLQHSGFT